MMMMTMIVIVMMMLMISYTRERHSSLNSLLFIVILVPESELLDELLTSYQSLSVATGYSMLVKLERSWRQSNYHLHPYFGMALFLFCVEKCSKVPWLQAYYKAFS